jgi:hypothetical protein
MYQIEGQYKESDYLNANHLHRRNGPVRRLLTGLAYLVLGVEALVMVGFFIPSRFWAGMIGMLILAAILGVYYYVYIPGRVKKIFQQQKELALPFRIQVDKNSARFENEIESGQRPWKMFVQWKEDQHLIILYLPGADFILLPKRLLTPAAADFIRGQLLAHKIPQK